MKRILLLFTICWSITCQAQNKDENTIRNMLHHQTEAWNRGDLEAFMQPYWQSDSLMFVGKGGVTWGWKNTLEHYRKGYPDKEAMGKLFFDIVKIQKLSEEYFFCNRQVDATKKDGRFEWALHFIDKKNWRSMEDRNRSQFVIYFDTLKSSFQVR